MTQLSLKSTGLDIVRGYERATYQVVAPLFCPWHNRWGEPVYRLSQAFEANPFTIHASSTSGSPVIVDAEGRFFGFGNPTPEAGCLFRYDGQGTLEIDVPAGQTLYVGEAGYGDDSWRAYNSCVLAGHGPAPLEEFPAHWADMEYCTWVEQKRLCQGAAPQSILNDAFLDQYIKRISELGLPPGKLTIDHGWQSGDEDYGDWLPCGQKFRDFPGTLARVADQGFTPGLWMAPVWIHPRSALARKYPELLGPQIAPSNEDSPITGPTWNYLKACPQAEDALREVFARFHAWGVRKFKFDMIYARKDEMRKLHAMIYRAVKSVSPEIEVEIHQPDIFFAAYGDAIRTNDVLCNTHYRWRELTADHLEVCEKSAPGRIINLDHIGGNDPAVTSEDFLAHLDFYRRVPGYPVVSLLGGNLDSRCYEELRELCHEHVRAPNAVSRFYQTPQARV